MARRRRGTWLVCGAALIAVLAGCDPWHCAFESHGACVEFAVAHPPADLAAARARMDRLLDLELPYWGLAGLHGWRIQYRDSDSYPCYLTDRNDGCTDYLHQTMSVRLHADSHGCFEAAELLHELGHFSLGDPMHSNDRWGGLEGQFAAVVWQRPDAPPECVARYRGVLRGMWLVNRNGF